MLLVDDLRCEYRKNPMGIDARRPKFGWKLISDKRGVLQSSYRLQVSASSDFSSPLWDSGETASGESQFIGYEGPQLEPETRYYFRVSVKDNYGEASPYSDPVFFETALFTAADWTADFITAQNAEKTEYTSAAPLFRKEFPVSGDLASARIYATALGMYELRLNGERVGDCCLTPGWTSYHKRLQYQTYDVTPLIRRGPNALGAMIGNGWYKGRLAGWAENPYEKYGSRTALLLELHLNYQDGRTEIIRSDESWKTASGPILMSEIYDGETYDVNQEREGWDTAGYDDGDWSEVYKLDVDKSILTAQENEPVRAAETLKPAAVMKTPKGETVLDFGQNMVGWVKVHADGPKGTKAELIHFEVFDRDGNVYLDNLRSAKQTVTYLLDGRGPRDLTPHFTFQGFRYVWVKEFPSEIKPEDFTGIVLHSDMEPAGAFTCSDKLVNRLDQNIHWGQKGNFVDVPTDCPQRDERLGWTGDAQVFCSTALFNMNSALFFKKWLRDMSADQHPDGGVPHVVPQVVEGDSATGWADASVICPWAVYLSTGDLDVLKDQYESMKAWVGYIQRHAENGLLWNTGFHFGDWLALDAREGSYLGATPNDLTATAFYANSVEILGKAASVLGKQEDAETYKKLHGDIVKAFQDEFITPNGRIASGTQTALVLALNFGLVREKDIGRTVDTLVNKIEQNKGHLETGFLGTPYICHVLSRYGRADAAYKLLMQSDYPSWLYQVKSGATTIWEHWDGIKPDGSFWSANMNSFNHYAYGSIGSWLYQVAAGINPDEAKPGYRHILLRPIPSVFSFAEARHHSLYGEIVSKWSRKEGQLSLSVSIPHNCTAALTLPGARRGLVELDGSPLEENAGTETAEGLQVELGSGTYTFSYPAKQP